jgi:hypothetical protein
VSETVLIRISPVSEKSWCYINTFLQKTNKPRHLSQTNWGPHLDYVELLQPPVKILGNNRDPYQQKAFFNLVFAQIPTYQEIVNGTPKLSLVFKLSEEFKTDKSALVTLVSRDWNLLYKQLLFYNHHPTKLDI